MNWQIFGRKTNGGCTSLSVACILFHGVVGVVKRLNVKQKQPQNAITMPPVILNLFNFVQFAYARHSSSKLDSALAQSQISGSHCEPSLTLLRGQMLKRVQHDLRMPPVILNLFNFVQFAYARHSSSKLDSALAQSQISGSHCEPSLSILRGQMLKRVQHDEVRPCKQ